MQTCPQCRKKSVTRSFVDCVPRRVALSCTACGWRKTIVDSPEHAKAFAKLMGEMQRQLPPGAVLTSAAPESDTQQKSG